MKPSPDPTPRTLVIISVASGVGAPNPACGSGPAALRRFDVIPESPLQKVEWGPTLRVPRALQAAPLHAVASLNTRLAGEVKAVLLAGHFPLVVGGDHSCAIGTWSGVHQAFEQKGPIGLIWIDAHMDSHTFATSPSGQLHGMPLACLLGHGDAALTAIDGTAAKLQPEHVCLIGVRSFEAGEAALLHQLGVRVFDMADIRRRGLTEVFDEALDIVQRNTAGFGVSIDLDALDPEDGPGVGSPVPGGLRRAELADALAQLRGNPGLAAMEIAEYNPRRDRKRATADAVGAFVSAITPLWPLHSTKTMADNDDR